MKNCVFQAIKKNNLDIITDLIDHPKFFIDTKDKNGNTPLLWAILQGKIDIALYLLDQNASIFIQNKSNLDALTLSFHKNHLEIAHELLKKEEVRIRIKHEKNYRIKCLCYCIQKAGVEYLPSLLKVTGHLSMNELGFALEKIESPLQLTYLVEKGCASINSLVSLLFSKGKIDFIKFLVMQKGISLSSCSIFQYKGLAITGNETYPEKRKNINFLLENGIDTSINFHHNLFYLEFLMELGYDKLVEKSLSRCGKVLNGFIDIVFELGFYDIFLSKAQQLFSKEEQIVVARNLLLNVVRFEANTYRHVKNYPVQALRVLVELGANINHIFTCNARKNETYLLACLRTINSSLRKSDTSSNQIVALAKNLIKMNIDITCYSPYRGTTPLMLAAKIGNVELVELLIDKGANLDNRDDRERRALNYIDQKSKNREDLVNILSKNMLNSIKVKD